MKENWMNKLIELLNEYEWYTDIPTWTLSWANEPLYWWWTAYASAYLIPSKKFWFIQRLVKHFMFDMTKIDARIALSDFNATDRMLMALAISEDPITLLVDCLK